MVLTLSCAAASLLATAITCTLIMCRIAVPHTVYLQSSDPDATSPMAGMRRSTPRHSPM